MGLKDRNYFWEDRKRREEQFKRDTYYRPKEFRRKKRQSFPEDWDKPPNNPPWIKFGFFSFGAVLSATIIMTALHLNPKLIAWLYQLIGTALSATGLK